MWRNILEQKGGLIKTQKSKIYIWNTTTSKTEET